MRSLMSLVVGLLVLVAWFEYASAYRGDGVFVDNGALAAHERFTIDLGAVDLSQVSRHEYRLSDLPDTEFTFGFRVTSINRPDVPLWESHSLNPTIRLSILDAPAPHILADGALAGLTWSGAVTEPERAFVYRRGSNFRPVPNQTYRVVLETVATDLAASKFAVHLVALGGGWK